MEPEALVHATRAGPLLQRATVGTIEKRCAPVPLSVYCCTLAPSAVEALVISIALTGLVALQRTVGQQAHAVGQGKLRDRPTSVGLPVDYVISGRTVPNIAQRMHLV
jgi:hypothetical protein